MFVILLDFANPWQNSAFQSDSHRRYNGIFGQTKVLPKLTKLHELLEAVVDSGKAGDELNNATEEAEKGLIPEAREHMKAWGALNNTFNQLTTPKANFKANT